MKTLYCDNNIHIEIESALGDDFLFMDDWAKTDKITPEEYELYKSNVDSIERTALFDRWKSQQQITSLRIFQNNVLIADNPS
jgi:hypothetical protein